jgi:hypothetical protein
MSSRVYTDEIELSLNQLVWVGAGTIRIRIDRCADGSVEVEVWDHDKVGDFSPVHIHKYSREV